MITRFLLIALLAFVPTLAPEHAPVRYAPGQGCFAEVEWGALSDAQKNALGDAINECTRRHFPDSRVIW